MSERFWIIVIVAVAVLILVFILRRQLKSLALKGMGMEATVQTHEPERADASRPVTAAPKRAGVNISGVEQTGKRHTIDVGRDDVNIEKTRQAGEEQEIIVRPDNPS